MNDTIITIDIIMEYFAIFRVCAKKGEEPLHLLSDDAGELYEMLRQQYRFPISKEQIHLVVNDEYSPWNKPLQHGDRVVFIPPVSGG